MTRPAFTLPLSFADACEVVRELLPPIYEVTGDGYEDERRYLVVYRTTTPDDPGWDLDVITVDKDSGWTTRHPWHVGHRLPERMRRVSRRA